MLYGYKVIRVVDHFDVFKVILSSSLKVFAVKLIFSPNGNMANLLLFYCKTWLFSKVQNCIFFSMCVDFSCRRTLTFHRANEFELERVMIRFPGLKMNSLKGKWKKKSNYFSRLKEEGARIRHSEVWVNIYGQIPEIVVNL